MDEKERGTMDEKEKEQDGRDGSAAHIIKEGFIDIKFQSGPVKENGKNGCQIEDVIRVLVDRLQGFQAGRFRCEENNTAIVHMQSALRALQSRTRDRISRGVEGKDEA